MAGSALRRLARDRLALFFIVLLPVIIILIIGLTFGDAGSERLPVGVVDQGAGRLGRIHAVGRRTARTHPGLLRLLRLR